MQAGIEFRAAHGPLRQSARQGREPRHTILIGFRQQPFQPEFEPFRFFQFLLRHFRRLRMHSCKPVKELQSLQSIRGFRQAQEAHGVLIQIAHIVQGRGNLQRKRSFITISGKRQLRFRKALKPGRRCNTASQKSYAEIRIRGHIAKQSFGIIEEELQLGPLRHRSFSLCKNAQLKANLQPGQFTQRHIQPLALLHLFGFVSGIETYFHMRTQNVTQLRFFNCPKLFKNRPNF